ncbi:MAG: divalent-cation tolerance protein CutA [Candidatus Babeliales bacterium]
MYRLKIFYITNESQQAAENLVKALLKKYLIGCANIFPIQSFYWDSGSIVHEGECVVIAKTLPQVAIRLEEEIKAIHPYKTPCIVQIDGSCNKDYFEWLSNELKAE